MARILIVFGSSHGHTGKIARRLAADLEDAGHVVTVEGGRWLSRWLPLQTYDACIVAASVNFGRHQPYIVDFARRHAPSLNVMPSAFLSVCGALEGSWPQGPDQAAAYVRKFLESTRWRPGLARSIAGALVYTQYRPFTRWLMKLISRRIGRPTDTSRDYDFTDWDAVDALAREVAALAAPAERPAALPG